jgi:hypothetical protein
MKTPLTRLALLGLSTAFFLLLAEGVARVLPRLPINAMGAVMRPDAILDHSLRPGSGGRMKSREYDVAYRVNALGMRDDEPRSGETGGILLLGDSFMEGYGVNRGEVLADRLEKILGVRVSNAGVKSYSPLLEYLYLAHRGLALRPDTVVLFFDLSDPANDEYYSRRLLCDDSGLPLAIRPRRSGLWNPMTPSARWLDDHSALYAYLLHMALKYFPESDADIGYAGAAKDLQPLWPGRDDIPDTAFANGYARSFEYLRAIRDLLAQNGVAVLVVVYPYGHQVAANAWQEGRLAHGFPPGVSSDRPMRFMESWCGENRIPCLSLGPVFRAHPDPGPLYFVHDGHWTAEGHRVAAEAVAEWMRSESGR